MSSCKLHALGSHEPFPTPVILSEAEPSAAQSKDLWLLFSGRTPTAAKKVDDPSPASNPPAQDDRHGETTQAS